MFIASTVVVGESPSLTKQEFLAVLYQHCFNYKTSYHGTNSIVSALSPAFLLRALHLEAPSLHSLALLNVSGDFNHTSAIRSIEAEGVFLFLDLSHRVTLASRGHLLGDVVLEEALVRLAEELVIREVEPSD